MMRPSTAVGWSQPQSRVISPQVRPATAIGWEDKQDIGTKWRGKDLKDFLIDEEEEEEIDQRKGIMGGGHSANISPSEVSG